MNINDEFPKAEEVVGEGPAVTRELISEDSVLMSEDAVPAALRADYVGAETLDAQGAAGRGEGVGVRHALGPRESMGGPPGRARPCSAWRSPISTGRARRRTGWWWRCPSPGC